MKKCLILIIFIIITLLPSCNKDSSTDNNSTVQTGVLWPLAVGNEWNYKARKLRIIVVENEIIFNNIIFYRINWEMKDIGEIFTNKDDGLYIIAQWDEDDQKIDKSRLLLKYPCKKGDKYSVTIDDYFNGPFDLEVNITSINEEVILESGTFNTIVYDIKNFHNRETHWLKLYIEPNIGPIKILTHDDGTSEIISWKLN